MRGRWWGRMHERRGWWGRRWWRGRHGRWLVVMLWHTWVEDYLLAPCGTLVTKIIQCYIILPPNPFNWPIFSTTKSTSKRDQRDCFILLLCQCIRASTMLCVHHCTNIILKLMDFSGNIGLWV
jgi:hypothetical protein